MLTSALGDLAAIHLVDWLRTSVKLGLALLLADALMSRARAAAHRRSPGDGVRAWCASHPMVVLLAGLVAIAAISLPQPHQIMADRLLTLRQSMIGWADTGELLTYRTADGLHRGTRGDDAGIYLLAPLFVALRLPAEAIVPLLWVTAALTMMMLWAAAVRLTSRGPLGPYAALAGLPALLLLALAFQRAGDIYWVPGAVGAAGTVALYADATTDRPARQRFALRWLLFGLLGGMATVFRMTASVLALVVILAGAVAERNESWRRRAIRLGAAALVVALPRLIVGTAEARRDARFAALSGVAEPMPSEHLFWHSIYIGMGVSPNPYGLVYKDSVARNYVRSVDPAASYMSPRYERILRDRVVTLVQRDPLFVLRQLLVKCALLTPLLLALAALLPSARRTPWQRATIRFAWCCAAAMAAGMLPGLIVVPIATYLTGAVSVLVVAALLLLYGGELGRSVDDVSMERRNAA